ncbi:filamentous hemagglutinin family protein [Janthinobacterium sp. 35]|uniref:YDG domain-containing protein n=1 Tax=Janthinobacterium sp. 35 TaxID=2035210 RepID=UPI000C1A5B4D|nr:YDG domain-containing protein [Janthinobacterium sp. 35]PIG30276.1 filamentous hemagglutinin family protein [Janthinobacterium sp. 35]
MNRIYRSIWNQATGAYAAVSENVKSAGKRSMPGCSGGGAHFALTSMAAALMLGYGSLALAGPAGGTVVAGQASITGAPGSTVIKQGSQNAVINWANFNINKGESVQFVQPNSNAVALNRVLGSDGTTILGNLSANGTVFIVNPNGVLFGQGASVNTAGLVASTLDISNADFMAGKYQFSGNGTGKVLNQGSISAPGGYVALLGANVSNEGTIQARLGSVALAAGRAITLDVAGDGLLNVAVNAGAVGALVSNGGMIKADGGSVVLTAQAAGDLLKTVVNNTGVIEAQTIDTRSGTIKLLGDMQTGTVNAAGTLDASAPTGGKGGFIDTSAAHVKLDDALKVTTASSHGLTGTWLIDPTDYTIAPTGGDQTGAFYTNALKSTSVQIQSSSGGTGTLGNINVNDTISWSANQLKLTAQNNININQPLRGSGTASLALEYGQQAIAASNLSTYNVKAEIDLPSGLNFSTKLGSDGTATAYTVITSLGAATSVSGTDLQGLKNALSGNFVLGANIDASGTANTAVWGANGFTPIGTTGTAFSGQFDGLGHVITGLNSSTTSAAGVAGLFGSSSGSIRNIGLVAPVISANIASTQGNIAALAAINSGTISNAYASGGSVTVTTGAIGAGLVGLNSGTISDSYNTSKVSVVGNYDFWMGGLVGNTTKTSTVINSYNAGEVIGAYTAGGLVGNNLGAITNSFNSGNVTGTTNTGGLTSHNRATGVITNSYNTGAVTSNSLTGGLVGSNVASSQILNSYSTGAVSSRSGTGTGFGGLVGGNSGIIRNSYATGSVTGVTAVGGLIGTNTSAGLTQNAYSSGAVGLFSGGSGSLGGLIGTIAAGTSPSITGGYYNLTVNPAALGVGTNGGTTTPSITGLTSSEMQVAKNFSAFVFTTTTGSTGNNWVMVNTDGTLNGAGNATGGTGPMLSAEYSTNIYSSHQLQLMAMNLAGNYTLKQDINAASTGTGGDVWNGATFVPVGTSTGARFTGTFDGAGHVISGLVVNRPGTDYAGLFGATSSSAIVRNVGLEGGSITGHDDTGALVGNNAGTISGSYSTMSLTGTANTGGLVGSNSGTVSNSYASGTVSGVTNVGGLVGLNSGTLTNNYATGAVSGTLDVGGLVGANSGSGSGNFWDATTTGQATSATGTGLTTTQMKALSTYSGAAWDLASTWIVYDSNTYPLLRAFMTPLQVTFASNASKTYDGTSSWTAPGATFSNPNAVLSGTLNYGAAGNAVNAGTYAITAGGLYSGQRGYAITSNTATLTIDRKAATLSGATVNARDYDGTTAATLSGGALSGVLSQDIFNINVNTGTFDTKDAGTGKAVTALTTGSAGGNYIVTATGMTGTITPKALTLSGLAATTKQYDKLASATVTGGTLNGLVTGETLSLGASSGTYQNANAGTDKTLTVTLGTLSDGTGLASNYTLDAPTSVTGTITAKTLTWTNLAVENKEYDGNETAAINKGSITGYVSGEGLVSGSTAAFADQNAGNNKVVTVHTTLGNGSGGGLASNYTLADTTVLASITPKTLTLTGVTAGNKTYDGTKAAAITGGTLGGMINGETVGLGTLSGSFADQNAGNGKAVTVTGGSLSDGSNGGLASNYTLASVTGLKADIAQQGLTVSGVTVASKDYDGTKAATVTGGTLNGLVNGETLSLSGQSGEFNDQNAGNGKAVTVTGATLGNGSGLASNYTVTNATDATGNITPKALTVTGASAVTRVYDGTKAATLAGGVLDGLVSGETLTLSGLSGAYATKNAGSGKAVTVTGATLADNTGGLASNYTVSNPTSVTGNVTKASISSVSGLSASDKTYDGSTAAVIGGKAVITGMVVGDDLAFSSASGAFSDQNAGTGKTVNISDVTLTGNDLANYNFTNTSAMATASIARKALTVIGATAVNRVYDGSTAATISGGSLDGLVGKETLTLTSMTGLFADKNVGTAKAVTVSGAVLTGGANGGLASNYTVTDSTGLTANITKATISTVSNIVADSKVYDANTKATVSATGATFNGMVGGDSLSISATSATFADKNAGNGKTVAVSGIALGGLDAGNYNLTSTIGSGTGAITPKALTITGMSAVSKAYDGNTKASVTGGSIDGLVGFETLGVTGLTVTFDDKNAGTGKAVTATGTTLVNGGNGGLASNYTMANPTGFTANITPKVLTVSGMTAGTRVYDGTTAATLAGGSLSGVISGETLVLSGGTGVFGDKNAGNGKTVTVSGISLLDGTGLASNYSVTNPTNVTGSITQKVLSVTGALAADKTYDGALDASITGGSLSGFVGSETVGLASLAGAFADKNAGSGKAVSITGGTLSNGSNGGLASNYSVGPASGLIASITQKALSVTGVAAANKVYDSTTKASVTGGSLNGLVGGETLGLSGLSGVFVDKNAGTGKTVTVSGATLADGTGLASNYTLSNPTDVTANINQATISSVTNVVADSKVYDGGTSATFAAATATFNGMVSGDSLAIGATKAAFSDKNAGTGKAVTISSLTLGGTDAANYTLASTTATGTGSITPKALTITGMSAVNKIYDGSTKATLSGGSISGLVGTETVGVTGLSATFDTKDAGTGKTVTATGSTLVNGGNGGLAANYTISNPTGLIASITPKALTVSGMTAGTRAYDGTTAATLAGGSLTGLVTGETLVVSGGTGVFVDKNAGNGKAVTVSGISLLDGTGLASNYTVSNPSNVTGSITQKVLSVTGALAADKTYDGALDATITGGTLSGLVGSETVGMAAMVGAFADKNAGSGKAVSVTGGALSNGSNGGLASNYTVSNPTGLTASITAKALTVSGQLAGNKVYDGNAQASLSGGALSGLVAGEALDIAGQTAVFSDKNAANGKAVTVTGTTLVDTASGLASNYTVSNPSGLTASITAKALTVNGQLAGNKVYDGNAEASLSGGALSGLVAGESLGIAGQTALFSDKNAANGKAVTVTGTSLVDTASGLASNYTVSNPTGLTASITAKALTVTGQLAGNKVYDGNADASLSGGALSGLVAGEALDIAGQTAVFSDKNAANGKAVTVTGTTLVDTASGLASNYTVSNPTGLTASITPKALTVAGQLAGNKVYDGNTAAQLSGGVLAGLVAGESLGIAGQTAVFSDKNAANGKAVTVTGTSLVDTASGLASNYTVSNPSGLTASITAKALTVNGQLAGNKVYDGNAEASLSGGALSGLVAGESLGIAGQTALFSDKNAANGKAVTVTGTSLVDTASGLASNYTVSNPTGLTASITAKALTVTGQLAGNKVYDGNADASLSGGALSGLVAGESLGIAGQTAVFSDKNAANGKAVTVTGTTLVDTASGLASNYTVSNPTGLTASITPKALTVAGQLAGNKVYDGNTAAQLSGGVLAGLVAGESLGIAGQTAVFSDKNAANGKAVTVTGTSLVDTITGLASNYTVSDPTGLTASITPASLLVRATGAAPRVYDTTTNASVTLDDNRIAGDVLSISSSGASFADKNAGANKTVTVNGIVLGGTDAGNYTVNATATTTASITQAELGVKVGNAEKDQGNVNPAFTASYTGLLGNDTLANEVSGNLAFSTPATIATPSGSYLVSAAGQTSTNYALTYTPGVLTVKPTEARQSAVASVIAAVNVAPSQGNMVQAEVVAKGETVTSKEDVVQVVAERGQPQQGGTPVVLTTASVNSNVLPGLRLSVVDTGLRLPSAAGNTSIDSQ